MLAIERMKDKLSKSSYIECFNKYGAGYLVISERDNLFCNNSLLTIDKFIKNTVFREDKGYFKEVYLAVRSDSGLKFIKANYLKWSKNIVI